MKSFLPLVVWIVLTTDVVSTLCIIQIDCLFSILVARVIAVGGVVVIDSIETLS